MVQKNNWCVYIHRCTINQKVYVGITSKKPETRWNHGNGYKGQAFYNAIQKYGWENFTHTIVKTGLSEKEAKDLEIKLIQKYDSHIRKNGYNVTLGGDGYLGVDNHGKNNPMYGKTHSPETRKKLSDAQKRRARPPKKQKILKYPGLSNKDIGAIVSGKRVLQYDLCMNYIGMFNSISSASEQTGISRGSIRKCCKGELGQTGGFIWVFESDLENKLKDKDTLILKATTNKHKENLGIAVYQLDREFNLINKFKSLHDAEKATGISRKSISNACKGIYKTAGGYTWRFEINSNEKWLSPIDFGRKGKAVLQFDMNGNFIREYKSCAEAARENGINRTGISKSCLGKTKYSGNYKWAFKEFAA